MAYTVSELRNIIDTRFVVWSLVLLPQFQGPILDGEVRPCSKTFPVATVVWGGLRQNRLFPATSAIEIPPRTVWCVTPELVYFCYMLCKAVYLLKGARSAINGPLLNKSKARCFKTSDDMHGE